jgi:hypothetical protein
MDSYRGATAPPANLERVVEFVRRLRERIAQVAGTLSFHVTPSVET